MKSLRHSGWIPGTSPRRASWLVPVLALCLLLAQSVDLVHNHDGAPDRRLDCEVCLKLGSNTVAAPAAGFSLEPGPNWSVVTDYTVTAPFIALPAPRSRAPPLA